MVHVSPACMRGQAELGAPLIVMEGTAMYWLAMRVPAATCRHFEDMPCPLEYILGAYIHEFSMYIETTHLATMGEPALVSSSAVASDIVLARLRSRLWPIGRD